jgi:hypothetical protein
MTTANTSSTESDRRVSRSLSPHVKLVVPDNAVQWSDDGEGRSVHMVKLQLKVKLKLDPKPQTRTFQEGLRRLGRLKPKPGRF